MHLSVLCLLSNAEALEGIDLGETTHKKPGTTVPESIHSFRESLAQANTVKMHEANIPSSFYGGYVC